MKMLTEAEYERLLKIERKLCLLEELGIEDWEGWDYAMRKFEKLEKEREDDTR